MMEFWITMDHIQAVCISLQIDNHVSTLSLKFYRPDVLPCTQSEVSEQCVQLIVSFLNKVKM